MLKDIRTKHVFTSYYYNVHLKTHDSRWASTPYTVTYCRITLYSSGAPSAGPASHSQIPPQPSPTAPISLRNSTRGGKPVYQLKFVSTIQHDTYASIRPLSTSLATSFRLTGASTLTLSMPHAMNELIGRLEASTRLTLHDDILGISWWCFLFVFFETIKRGVGV